MFGATGGCGCGLMKDPASEADVGFGCFFDLLARPGGVLLIDAASGANGVTNIKQERKQALRVPNSTAAGEPWLDRFILPFESMGIERLIETMWQVPWWCSFWRYR